jgi:hypothetical protein
VDIKSKEQMAAVENWEPFYLIHSSCGICHFQPLKLNFKISVGQTLTVDLNFGLHPSQLRTDSQKLS